MSDGKYDLERLIKSVEKLTEEVSKAITLYNNPPYVYNYPSYSLPNTCKTSNIFKGNSYGDAPYGYAPSQYTSGSGSVGGSSYTVHVVGFPTDPTDVIVTLTNDEKNEAINLFPQLPSRESILKYAQNKLEDQRRDEALFASQRPTRGI